MPVENDNSLLVENYAGPDLLKLGHQPALDGLRGLAILVVMAFNGKFLWMRGGFVGVDIFFVLSGFLITSLLVQGYHHNSSMGLKNFYFRRALRLLPALVLLILFCVAYAVFLQPWDKAIISLKGVVYTLFYVANWAQVPPNGAIGALSHAWSLSVEEQFYIVWPVLLLGLLKLRSRVAVLAILAATIAISMFAGIWMWSVGTPYLRMYYGSDSRAHELLIGCVAALLVSWGALRGATRYKKAFHAAAIISLVGILTSCFLARYYGAFVYNGGFTLVCVGTAVLILDFVLIPSRLSRAFEFKPLVWIGRISYGLYLWHFPIFEGFQKMFEGRVNPILLQVSEVAVTVLVATASYYLLEQPFLKLKHRFDANGSTYRMAMSASQTVST